MIITKTPLRISFIGGGTDHLVDEKSYGSVIATSIDKFIYLSLIENYQNKYLVNYSQTEKVSKISQIKHSIVRETLKYFKINKPIEVHVAADITSRGSGLGSSGSFSVGLVNLLSHYKKISLKKKDIAKLAYDIEINKCNNISGKQDQYQSSFGGLNQIFFYSNGNVKVKKLKINSERIKMLENNLIVFNTSKTRKSANIQKQLSLNKKNKDEFKILNSLLKDFKQELIYGDLDNCGRVLHESWKIKKKFTSKISNPLINKSYNIAIKNGAIGGKILGAGGGGFLLFYCKKENQIKFIKKLNFLQKLEFEFYKDGSIFQKI